MSKKIGRVGEFGSDMVSASITMSVEDETEIKDAYSEAWDIVKEEVKGQEALLAEKKEMKEVADNISTTEAKSAPPQPITPEKDPIMTSTTPRCPIHGNTVTYRPSGISKKTGKPYPGFYSCTAKTPDGQFCKERAIL